MIRPTAAKLAIEVARIKSSFASLTADDGSYLQIAGGPGLFMLEFHDARRNQFRGFQDEPVAIHPDGTILMSSAGQMPMARAEWFLLRQITEALAAFLEGGDLPEYLRWRSVD